MLADYAVRVEATRGRRYPEPQHPYRNDFQRDRDRVIHSRAFRRLEAKTQVFTRRGSDHFRNRLTHTFEVAQISRTVGAQLGLNVDLVEALSLLHDVGHPPFGHAGERALNAAMRQHSLFFDHNLHALRIVEDFEMRYAAFRGLNLTFEVREGIVKHSRDYQADAYPELAEYLLDRRPPLEAQLIDLADEIAYDTADLDDGYESRLLTLERMQAEMPVFAELYAKAELAWPSAPEKLKFNETLRQVLDRLVGDLIRNTETEIEIAGVRSLEDVRSCPRRLVGFSPAVDSQRQEIKNFLHRRLYMNESLNPDKADAEKIVSELFALWMKKPDLLPASYQKKSRHEALARVVGDYIAGMTDNFIYEQYEKLRPT